MSEEIRGIALTEEISNSQKLFVRYLVAVLIDLTVLNLLGRHGHHREAVALGVVEVGQFVGNGVDFTECELLALPVGDPGAHVHVDPHRSRDRRRIPPQAPVAHEQARAALGQPVEHQVRGHVEPRNHTVVDGSLGGETLDRADSGRGTGVGI